MYYFRFLPWTLFPKKLVTCTYQISRYLLVHKSRLWGFQKDPTKACSKSMCGLCNYLVKALKRTRRYVLIPTLSTRQGFKWPSWKAASILILILPLLSCYSLPLQKAWAGLWEHSSRCWDVHFVLPSLPFPGLSLGRYITVSKFWWKLGVKIGKSRSYFIFNCTSWDQKSSPFGWLSSLGIIWRFRAKGLTASSYL